MGARQPTVAKRATNGQVLDLNRIDAFVQVMDAGSFTAAARHLGLPKSSLSRAISKLEAELGVVLIQRTTRKLAITEAGQFYLDRARSALGSLAEARAQLIDADAEPRGIVRFTAPLDPIGGVMASALAAFVKRYPGIHVDCVFTQRRVDMVAEGIDLALRAGLIDDASLAGRKLGDTPLALYASPGYLAERGTPTRIDQLSGHDCVLFRGARGRARWALDGPDGKQSVEVRGPINVDELPFAVHLAVLGSGIALLPITFARQFVAAGALVRVLADVKQAAGAVYLVHPVTHHLPRRVALLRDHLFDALQPTFAS